MGKSKYWRYYSENNFVFLVQKCIKTDNNSELINQLVFLLIYNPIKQLFAKLKQ